MDFRIITLFTYEAVHHARLTHVFVVVCFSTFFFEFRYLALHNTHGPVEAPEEFESLYKFPFALQNTFDAMVSVVDSTVANVTSALKSTGMWNTTLVIWTTDNGSPCEVCNRITQVFFFIEVFFFLHFFPLKLKKS